MIRNDRRLVAIKLVHTGIWVFFNAVVAYMLYAALTDRIDRWFWCAVAAVSIEIIVLAIFRMSCPLTVWASRYSDATSTNFDIYLPEWLARCNKIIYSIILVAKPLCNGSQVRGDYAAGDRRRDLDSVLMHALGYILRHLCV